MNRRFFTFKNLAGEYPALEEQLRLGLPTAVFGVSDPHKYLLASLPDRRVLYIAPTSAAAAKAYASIAALSGRRCALLPPKDDVILYKDALSKDSLYRRNAALAGIESGAEIIVTDAEAAMQLYPRRLKSVRLARGDDCDYSALPSALVQMGYTRGYAVEGAGTFAVRGDILDIFPVNSENPVRVDFFGDTVERIRPYDAVSGERLEETAGVDIVSAEDFGFCAEDTEAVTAAFNRSLKKCSDMNALRRAKFICEGITEKMREGLPFAGVGFVAPLLSEACALFDLIGRDTLIILDECKLIDDTVAGAYREHTERVRELIAGGDALDFSLGQLIAPERLIASINSFGTLAVQTFTAGMQFFSPLKTFNLRSTPAPSYLNAVPRLIEDLKRWLGGGYRVAVFTGSVQRSQKLCDELAENYIPLYPMPDSLQALHGVSVTSEELEHGFIIHESKLVVIGSYDLYTKAVTKRIRRRRGDMFSAPEVGDFAVHEKHGIGRITGTKRIETTDGVKEYVSLEYSGGDVLYVPVEQMDSLSKYVGESSPALSRIGGADFARIKEKVKRSIRSLAFDLKQLYAERADKKGHVFPENRAMMQEFEEAFTYEETPDQLASIAEIKADMCSEKVMDRLLCGDVGFGKTEVALRAVYLCVLGGKQAALMCPGTVLSEQHFNTAVERFADFGVRVEKLNRFLTPKQQEAALKRLRDGDVDFVIGTHRLLSEDVKFCDLGLLVLDEEQRFGVEHKEKIKRLKSDIDCLTMTATPIPRTLHMSLAGIRDISTISTPPQKRLPVQTYVVDESETLIRDACIRELSRGGQVFILYNRVESIATFADKVARIVPEGRVCYAHGRMERTALENSVFSFYRGERDILVTTTIIENGIDLPNANTIIVIDADRLGISQLYQLRGRVGRSTRLAHAYFTFKPTKVLTSDAAERLKAIMQFTELGSGFKVAMRDLEIRGAGNVLGAEQHGHMDRVGYELYSKLLKEELTGESAYVAELDIKTAAYIPESYIESNAGRMDCYKQIAEIRSIEDYKRVYRSMDDNYGEPPGDVVNLLVIAVLKAYASKLNVRKISVNAAAGSLELPSINSLKDENLCAALEKYKNSVRLSMTKAPVLVFAAGATPRKTMLAMTKFLKIALKIE